jgi:GNAT superfamily N-acetyltransferase
MTSSCLVPIRPARESDVPDILAMIRELARFENLEDTVQINAGLLQSALFGPVPAASALVARAGGETAGYALYYTTFSTFAGHPGVFLEDLYVRPKHRKQGIGRALLTAVGQIAAKRQCGRFEWMALRWNENALRLYEQIGARPLEEWVSLRMEQPQISEFAGHPVVAQVSKPAVSPASRSAGASY